MCYRDTLAFGGEPVKWIPRIAMLSFVVFAATLLAAQRGRIQGFGGGFGGEDYGPYGEESHQPTEFSWSRLRYDTARYGGYRPQSCPGEDDTWVKTVEKGKAGFYP